MGIASRIIKKAAKQPKTAHVFDPNSAYDAARTLRAANKINKPRHKSFELEDDLLSNLGHSRDDLIANTESSTLTDNLFFTDPLEGKFINGRREAIQEKLLNADPSLIDNPDPNEVIKTLHGLQLSPNLDKERKAMLNEYLREKDLANTQTVDMLGLTDELIGPKYRMKGQDWKGNPKIDEVFYSKQTPYEQTDEEIYKSLFYGPFTEDIDALKDIRKANERKKYGPFTDDPDIGSHLPSDKMRLQNFNEALSRAPSSKDAVDMIWATVNDQNIRKPNLVKETLVNRGMPAKDADLIINAVKGKNLWEIDDITKKNLQTLYEINLLP